MLAHKASHEGRVAVEVIAGRERRVRAARDSGRRLHRSRDRVGRADRGAGAEGRTARSTVAKFPWGASGRAITLDRTDGLTKLILDPETERLLGVGLVGPGAGELIAEGVLAIEMGATATDLKLVDPSASDAHRDADGVGRSVLRPGDARLPAEARLRRGQDVRGGPAGSLIYSGTARGHRHSSPLHCRSPAAPRRRALRRRPRPRRVAVSRAAPEAAAVSRGRSRRRQDRAGRARSPRRSTPI